jgi:sporulation inhibitor KapD
MNKDFFVVDFEFTQYTKPVGKPRAFFSEIIEIGAVRIDSDTKEITGHIEDFVKPHFFPKQAAEGMEFSMITESDMENAIDFSEMLQQIESLYVPGETYFVTWGNADYKVINQGCERHKLTNPVLLEDYLDLAAAYKILKGDKNTTGLRKAVEELSINADGFGHTAYDDAYNTGKILLKLIAAGWKPEDYFSRLVG